jgi:hypothetical protein
MLGLKGLCFIYNASFHKNLLDKKLIPSPLELRPLAAT